MEVIRKIVNANILTPIIDLPWKAENMRVEVIVIPVDEMADSTAIAGISLKGCLKKYADPALLEKEQHVWENHIVEKYATL